MSRRRFLGTLAALSASALVPRGARADDYALPAEVMEAIDRREADVDARLRGIAAALPSAQPFATAVIADHDRFRSARGTLRRRLRLPAASSAAAAAAKGAPVAPVADRSLEGLRAAQEALVHAHAEGLPALGDASVVDVLAHHMVEGSRHLAVVQLWIETDADRG